MKNKEVSASEFDALMKEAVQVKHCSRCGSYGGQIRIDFPLYGADGVYCRCYSCGFETKRRNTHICMTDDKKRLGTPTIEKSLMVCLTLHSTFGFGEKRLDTFLAQHKALFIEQQRLVNAGTQLEVIDERINSIFRRHGFLQYFFDKMLGPVEISER